MCQGEQEDSQAQSYPMKPHGTPRHLISRVSHFSEKVRMKATPDESPGLAQAARVAGGLGAERPSDFSFWFHTPLSHAQTRGLLQGQSRPDFQ